MGGRVCPRVEGVRSPPPPPLNHGRRPGRSAGAGAGGLGVRGGEGKRGDPWGGEGGGAEAGDEDEVRGELVRDGEERPRARGGGGSRNRESTGVGRVCVGERLGGGRKPFFLPA